MAEDSCSTPPDPDSQSKWPPTTYAAVEKQERKVIPELVLFYRILFVNTGNVTCRKACKS